MGRGLPRQAALVRGLLACGTDFGGVQPGCGRATRRPATRLRRSQHEDRECAGREQIPVSRVPQRLGTLALAGGASQAEACATMLRRELLATLAACVVGRARGSASLEPFFESRDGAGIMLDVRSRRVIAIHAAAVAGRFLAPPGSTLKPFVLATLLRSGKLTATESLLCPGRLTIGGRSFDCSHPRFDSPMRVETALAYSCNCFVARVAERFAPGELPGELARAGFSSPTGLVDSGEASGRIRPAADRDAVRLLALGEEG